MDQQENICPHCGEVHDLLDAEDEEIFHHASATADSFVKSAFPELWSEIKEEAKEISRKELAQRMFRAGASNMLYAYIQLIKAERQKERGEEV